MWCKNLSILYFMLIWLGAAGQTDSNETMFDDEEPVWLKADMNEVHEYGIRLGTGFSTMLGGELDNPRLALGLNGSGYYRYRYSKRSALQCEVGISFRGSNFDNGSGEYSAIKTYYVDAPLFWVKAIDKTAKTHLILGAQYSRLLSSSIFIDSKQVEENQKPKFKKDDVLLLAGTQFYAGFVGFQLVAKYGLIDINNGLIDGLNPPFKNKDIHNFVLEINFLF
ncbi:MAG: hypothetical protein EAY81_04305 [Bacteroidetes bacterium]|nr:MAG: hypothetical protein EAY81_04305 [Bacteroidota bacterium]